MDSTEPLLKTRVPSHECDCQSGKGLASTVDFFKRGSLRSLTQAQYSQWHLIPLPTEAERGSQTWGTKTTHKQLRLKSVEKEKHKIQYYS